MNIVKYFIEEVGQDPSEICLISFASVGGHLEIIKYLHNKGGDIHELDDLPLVYAVKNNHTKLIKYI